MQRRRRRRLRCVVDRVEMCLSGSTTSVSLSIVRKLPAFFIPDTTWPHSSRTRSPDARDDGTSRSLSGLHIDDADDELLLQTRFLGRIISAPFPLALHPHLNGVFTSSHLGTFCPLRGSCRIEPPDMAWVRNGDSEPPKRIAVIFWAESVDETVLRMEGMCVRRRRLCLTAAYLSGQT